MISVHQMDIYKLFLIIVILLSILLPTGCASIQKTENTTEGTLTEFTDMVEDVDKKMYQDIADNFNKINISEIDTILNSVDDNKTYYFYFGRTTCVYCRKFIIENEKSITGLQNFFYIDTADFSEDETLAMNSYGIEYVPAILFATNHNDIAMIDVEKFIADINE